MKRSKIIGLRRGEWQVNAQCALRRSQLPATQVTAHLSQVWCKPESAAPPIASQQGDPTIDPTRALWWGPSTPSVGPLVWG
ncbi:hypothetical protein LSTR_LSTR007937 [Laodelphax striatellus]|uniref:Uncharacterized protein n=1 Tax=Laodelphax striatellus TaxID=195883 RepID=A0A482XR44_LAOST|nr:hypothetical protein LSTR_LSTR007937 [Laodelphax striatellus]